MDLEIYKRISLFSERELQWGGAQRLISVMSKKLKKPIYVLTENKKPSLIWGIQPIKGIPETDIVFSVVVHTFNFVKLQDKKQIKFCHSGESLANFIDNEDAKRIPWITHRERAFQVWKEKGFNIHYIHKGYIPYDKTEIVHSEKKENCAVFVSRLCQKKGLEEAIELAKSTEFPLHIAGSWEFKSYVNEQKKKAPSNVYFVPPEVGGMGVPEYVKNDLLKRSKVLIHGSIGGFRDYLEYSLIDGMLYGCVPLCITPDKDQFKIINSGNMGKTVSTPKEGIVALRDIIDNYPVYAKNIENYMANFLLNQNDLWKRWENSIEDVVRNHLA